MKIAYIVDSTADLDSKYENHPDIYRVDLHITYENGDVIIDSKEESKIKEFYNRIKTEKVPPKTSQPTPQSFMDILDDIVEKGYDAVIGITVSAKLSGTFQTMKMIMEEYKDKLQVYPVNSENTSYTIGNMVEQAMKMNEKNIEIEKIVEHLKWVASETDTYLLLKDLHNLVKGGRLKSTSAALGSLLRIRPIMMFDNEEGVKLYEKVRTDRRVMAKWIELLVEKYERFKGNLEVVVVHGDVEQDALKIVEKFKDKFPELNYHVFYLGTALGVHGGNGAIGMEFIPNKFEE